MIARRRDLPLNARSRRGRDRRSACALSPATRSSRCVRSATIPWGGCTAITRSTRRSIRADAHSRTIGRRPSAGRARSIRPANMSMADNHANRSPSGQRHAVLRLNRVERELGADGIVARARGTGPGDDDGADRPAARPARSALDGLFRATLSGVPRSPGADLRLCEQIATPEMRRPKEKVENEKVRNEKPESKVRESKGRWTVCASGLPGRNKGLG